MKFRVLYNTKIGDKYQKAGDIIDLPDGTDRNFIQRMQTIGALQAISEEEQERLRGQTNKQIKDAAAKDEDDQKDASATDKANKTAGNKQTKGNKDK
ncbi:hypothetical protein [uncultured Campylobacter sp.]|jgi:hypothetical protein|uniref:hypothetical protein n=1 Tax=uncultured Campylobacter sp. TaxID=218934 RepID=UPI00205EBF38|nr:hypothetical protein [uncultured Campylobacter sp.]DAK15218.1 MAG TPA: hypothetical protein [Caudoviricetes sp.]DAS13699.1 MAG TPA: hypothetical protein [Caudoviricetes sp.]